MKRNAESGSILWFILLAVALLAALAFTITRTSGTSQQMGTVERQKIAASSLIRYAAAINEAIDQMRLRGGSENTISFDDPDLTGYANTGCADASCKVFDKGGGGMTYTPPPENANDGSLWLFTGANEVAGVGEAGQAELLMILPNVTKDLCAEVNAEIGVAAIPKAAGKIDTTAKFTGSFAATPLIIDEPQAKKTGCLEGNQDSLGADISGHYFFYHTLLAR